MSLVFNSVFDGGADRQMVAGDIVNGQEILQDVNNAAGVTLTAQQMITGLIGRRGAAAVSDTLPDATSLVNALLANGGYQGGGAYSAQGLQYNSSFRVRIVNGNSGLLTIAAGTNFTLVTTYKAATLAAAASADLLVQILNGTPPQTYAANTTNASAIITGLSALQTLNLTPGMAVSGTGIPASTTILSVQPGVGVTLSANATATGSLVALAFAPRAQAQFI